MSDLATSEIAKAMGCCTKTVNRLIDSGDLPGYRIPSGRRRVRHEKAIAFFKRHGIPVPQAWTKQQ